MTTKLDTTPNYDLITRYASVLTVEKCCNAVCINWLLRYLIVSANLAPLHLGLIHKGMCNTLDALRNVHQVTFPCKNNSSTQFTATPLRVYHLNKFKGSILRNTLRNTQYLWLFLWNVKNRSEPNVPMQLNVQAKNQWIY